MTTHRPTGSEPPASPIPAETTVLNLPDEATINRLAGAFFAALPSGMPGVAALGVAAPSSPAGLPDTFPSALGSVPTGSVPVGSVPTSSVPTSSVPTRSVPTSSVPTRSVPTSSVPTGSAPQSSSAPGAVSAPRSSAPQGAVPPGGPTPDVTVPAWGADVPMSTPSGPPPTSTVRNADIHTDPFLVGLPSLEQVLSPPRDAGPPAVGAPEFYFLERPQAPAAPVNSQFYFLDAVRHRAPDRHPPFDVHAVRNDFPILSERVNGHPLVWFDNAATTQKPRSVIERIAYFYEHENSNIHRAAHELAARSTDAYERARDAVTRFIGASSAQEIVFVRGATEGINLIAQTWGRKHIREGDEILISHLEHHANIVPWQMLCAETGALLKVIPVDDRGQLLMDEYTRLLSDRTKLVSVTQVSNALGTITPVHEIVAQAHRAGAIALIDGAQSVPHTAVDVRSIGADFFVFSGHKLFGPTGIGVVYGNAEVLRDMPPWQGGGNMISDVTLERSLFQPPPGRFEAGTGNIADAVGLGAAIDYVERLGMDNISRYEHGLLEYATPRLAAIPGVRLVGTAADKASVLSFVMDGYEPLEVGKALNEKGIAVRAGHHCAQPILRRLGLEATVRPSFAFYNTCEEIDRMISELERLARAVR
ncbi:family 2A encapsulin nanocompartment cargo protein cysteine desulfurase [Nocardia jejuensis]|uniref:family 2A encapsulin nanocompartment cargo protein cysteine desulfurase n=1 Tax=Nocardia jejuensis TaxID=328049 RepID=UPI0009FEC964|nr:family 2A encapsulin nanocompartment cargo protein cysteine desulfurase [Nocardia jejuensis]